MRSIICLILLIFSVQFAFAQQKEPIEVRRVPAIGIQIPEADEKELETGLQEFAKTISQLKLKQDKFTASLLPDVLIYYKAIDYALKYHEFFHSEEVASAKKLLQTGRQRAVDLLEGKAPWTTQKGEVVRGYISKIDGSVQPYGLSIPENDGLKEAKYNLSFWFHGRGEYLSELNFIANGKGFFPAMPALKNTIMLYPYGRYCNGFKFAGEVDVQEALAAVKKQYPINENGIFDRGFSMGGAAVWHFAVHYPDFWLAANPGAGFAETTEFLLLDNETLRPNWYEKKLLHLYDCTDYASNLSNLPIIAYNGDKDLQKQAADVMEKAMKQEGIPLTRIVGPNTGHAYHPASAKIVDSLLEREAAKGKRPAPKAFHFTTYTLKYNKMYWLNLDALKEHWEKAHVDGTISSQTITLKTTNVLALSLAPEVLSTVINLKKPVTINIDGTNVKLKQPSVLSFYLENGNWVQGTAKSTLVKKHELQGPIDDAFMSAFIVVKPTGKSKNELFDKWSKAELDRFLILWRRQFRGDAIVKNDVDVTSADLSSNLIVFGDEESNKFVLKIKNKLPIKWDSEKIKVGDTAYSSKDHALVMICPNPLNTQKYVVLNSGFTFREASFLNNAKQIPMLPDWAIVDLNTPPGPVYPGKVSKAGFFGEDWKWKSKQSR
ncbi:prolyl oligopeptidase family serine peptidase [uncultured Mucilaginibacter sp.]|uniref:prolyl oligopeptidase family serine peptidase n=1 Tax=uncultured Mucilaginibacter sp. TaxID=797541 RepID=UPI00262B6F4E|nr:prolyl oligopeptidase family serine peptidase [uncultured Mucilaginibacter sp.]